MTVRAGSVVGLGWGESELRALGASHLADLYRSPAVLEQERARVLRPAWTVGASTEAVQEPGDYLAVEAAGAPLVVVRDTMGRLRCFHNVCPHRGLLLLEGAGRLGRHVTCPYHQWSFGLDGALVRVPQADDQLPDLDRSDWPLRAAPVAEWEGLVLVSASPEAPSLEDALGGLRGRIAALRPPGALVEVACEVREVGCNWKLLVENHVDVYHLWYLHKESLSGFDHRRFRWEHVGRGWTSVEPPKEGRAEAATLIGVAAGSGGVLGAHLVFPNVLVVTTPEYLAVYDAVPLAPDRTRVTLRIRARPETDPGPLLAGVSAFLTEDVEACERLQAGTASPAFDIGPLCRDHEAPVVRFHQELRQVLVGGEATGGMGAPR